MVLARILAGHPSVREIVAVSGSQIGKLLTEADPGLDLSIRDRTAVTGGRLVSIEEAASLRPDVVFSALPHLESSRACAAFLPGSVVIDLSADLRIRDRALFRAAYGEEIASPGMAAGAVYGLVEWFRDAIRSADVIASPGCYPTVSLLPLLPLASTRVISGTAVVNAGSGISGAGRKAVTNNLFSERAESYTAYSPGKSHRHWPEIAEKLRDARPDMDVLFTPHLVPMRRGIAATTVVALAGGAGVAEVDGALARAYGSAPCMRLTGDRIPQTSDVWGSNRCDIGRRVEGGYLMLFSAIDNLVKGASGQAVQCMNVRFGLDETAGLELHGLL